MNVLADLSSGAVGGLLGGIGTLAKDIREAITGDISAEKKAELQQKVMEIELQAMQGQMAINVEEAKSESTFVAGWRPFVGWVGGLALAYSAIVHPFAVWLSYVLGYKGPAFPTLDTTITMQVLFGILGLGAYRSYDKAQRPNDLGKE